jgi:hypothetical protein
MGYEVIRVPIEKGHATGEYEDFLTGFVTPSGDVSDDGSNTVWRVRWGTL